MGICAGKPATKTSEHPNSQVEPVENGYQVNIKGFQTLFHTMEFFCNYLNITGYMP